MHLEPMTPEYCERVRQWRNKNIDVYRTPFMLTEEMQKDFYDNVICNRDSTHRFWAVMDDTYFVGQIGLVNISLENRSAEISIVIEPLRRGDGIGRKAFELLLLEGFNRLNLDNIYGECYMCNQHINFWGNICKDKGVKIYELPRRKYCNGKYYDSIYFNFEKGNI